MQKLACMSQKTLIIDRKIIYELSCSFITLWKWNTYIYADIGEFYLCQLLNTHLPRIRWQMLI